MYVYHLIYMHVAPEEPLPFIQSRALPFAQHFAIMYIT